MPSGPRMNPANDESRHPAGGEQTSSPGGHQKSKTPKGVTVSVELSPGELIDKITILSIKNRRITDPEKRRWVQGELEMLTAIRDQAIPSSNELAALTNDLEMINEQLWAVEDEIRLCEQHGDFGTRFIELARSVYGRNDERAELKARIDELLGAAIREQKFYHRDG